MFGLTDHCYRAHNAYYGGQVGVNGSGGHYGRWSLNMRGEIGLGANAEQVRSLRR